MTPRVCTIVLNWNRWRDTIECLESLICLSPPIKTIIVCDNGSSDGSREKILSWAGKKYGSPSVPILRGDSPLPKTSGIDPFIYIQNQSNLGYAGGNNAGIRVALSKSCFDFIWVLNNDTLVHEDAIESFLRCARNHPKTGIFGSTIVFANRPEILQCAGGCRYNPITTIYRPVLGGEKLSRVLESGDSSRLDYVYGASMFIRTEVFERIGLFSEEYFLFYEELDLCHRAEQAGFKIGWCKESIVYHKSSRTIGWPGLAEKGKIAIANYHENLSTLIFTKKFYPAVLPFAMIFRFFGKLAFIIKRKDRHLIRPLLLAYRDFLESAGPEKGPIVRERGRSFVNDPPLLRKNSRIRVLVNAVPMANLNTGIGRYLRSLYTEMERLYGDRLKIGYFDGFKVSETMP
ncbi:MAG: glycosyltransferase family 2 protein, partial [Deltaproteobacteria bacterium]|nr:glycosyltransferase family 2 protein [Deltaproteobacteria bacterium]